MRQTEFLTTACDPKTLTVGQLMQDAVFTCGSRTDALTILPTSRLSRKSRASRVTIRLTWLCC